MSPPKRDSRGASPPIGRRLLDVRAAGEYLGLSPWTVRRLCWGGDLPEVRIGRRLLVDVRDLEVFVLRAKAREPGFPRPLLRCRAGSPVAGDGQEQSSEGANI